MVYGEQGHRWGATAFTARDGSAYANHISYGGGTLGGSSRGACVALSEKRDISSAGQGHNATARHRTRSEGPLGVEAGRYMGTSESWAKE